MNKNLENLLLDWSLPVIRDVDIATVIFDNASKRYATVNRATKRGILIPLRRGYYLIGKPYRKSIPGTIEIASTLYGPSYISFESALFYHQWIPEAVYTTTCATAKRAQKFETSLGLFQYVHVPQRLFYLGVERMGTEMEAFFMASPWKALADHYYVYNRDWHEPEDLCSDMRIEMENLRESDLTTLELLSKHYQSLKVRKFLNNILRSLTNNPL